MAGKTRIEVTGLEEVQRNLRREVRRIEGNTHKGVRAGLGWLKGKVIRVTPVDEGILRGSAFTRSNQSPSGDIDAIIGFTASYAPHVHENVGANFRAPGTKAKFLEDTVQENQTGFLERVAKMAKI